MSDTVITDSWLAKVMDAIQAGSFGFDIAYFKIGEGGWYTSGAIDVPRNPDPTLSDIDALENPSRYPVDGRYYFQKNIDPSKIVEDSPTQVTVECIVDSPEGNTDDYGFSPEFWELGIFDSEDTMISYTTFSRQPKDDTVALRHFVTISIARAS